MAEQGRFSEISEQQIGVAVFERSPNYDPTIDSIVRSHASRLRHRLREYFDSEGIDEPLLLLIPKGSYIPNTVPRVLAEKAAELKEMAATTLENAMPGTAPQTQGKADRQASLVSDPILSVQLKRIRGLQFALVLVGLVAMGAIGALLHSSWNHSRVKKRQTLSGELFPNANEKVLLVGADSGLVILQHLTQRPVSLAAYMSRDYVKNLSSPYIPEQMVSNISTRRYMPVIDQSIFQAVANWFGEESGRVTFRFARDLLMDELKQNNAILLGSRESNPWVELFEPSMNFYFQDDLKTGMATMLNRHPEAGEPSHYDMSDNNQEHTVYGLIAYRPNLSSSGRVLILEGQTLAGTQTASDFVFNGSNLLWFFQKIRRSDGSIPYFELLLRSKSLGGESSKIEIVSYRISAD